MSDSHSGSGFCDDADSQSNSKSQSQSRIRTTERNFKQRFSRWMLVVLAIVISPYAFYRLTSDSRILTRCNFPEPHHAEGKQANLNVANVANGALRSLRIATWNIAHGRGSGNSNWEEGVEKKRKRIAEIATEIRKLEADVVVLNEVDFSATWSGGFDQAEMIAKQAGYPICIKQANLDFGFLFGRWYFGNAILSRIPISNERVVELQPFAQWESYLVGHKRGLSCTIEVSPQRSLSIIGLHLESRGETIRVKQIDDVARHAGQLITPLVVAGDLNTTPSDFPNSHWDANGVNAFDKLIQQTEFTYSPTSVASIAGPQSLTFSSTDPTSLIDWILLSHELRFVDQEIIDLQLSDHRPVVATIEFLPED